MESKINKSDLEKEIRELGDSYNAELETLNNLQTEQQKLESSTFKILQKLYSSSKNKTVATGLESRYESNLEILNEKKSIVSEQQSVCFHMLQKLRTIQTNYLVGIINSLQAQLNELQNNEKSKSERSNNL